MGDPGGIGPEVILKALNDSTIRRRAHFRIYGVNDIFTSTAETLGIEPFWYRVAHDSDRANARIVEPVVVLDYPEFSEHTIRPEPTPTGGQSSKLFVEDAIADALKGQEKTAQTRPHRTLDALVTAPISKQAWRLAKFNWPGHTELLAHRTKAKRHAMAFVSPRLKVILATTHLPLMDIRNVLTIGRVFNPIDLGHEACLQMGILRPRIAVTGLNPHAGENGLMGDEEERVIRPAIELAQQNGILVEGPFPADTLFIKAAAGDYDLVVAMYHDQGLIPVKLLGWDSAVNWTVGLPIIRTSPDHGTAYDLTGKGKASPGSMRAAIELAIDLAHGPREGQPPMPAVEVENLDEIIEMKPVE